MSINTSFDLNTSVSNFFQNGAPITFETEDLTLCSIQETDLDFMQTLYTDRVTMRLFADNEVRLEEKGIEAWKAQQMKAAKERIETFVKRWTVDKIPFSGFLITTKNDPHPIGFISPGFGNKPGQLEIFFAIIATEHGKGFGLQAVHAIVQRYIPVLIENHYRMYHYPLETIGAPVTEMRATVRWDNGRAIRILEKVGMIKIDNTTDSLGLVRDIYSIAYKNPPLKENNCVIS